MKNFKIGANFAVFVLFFGLAILEAFKNQNWLESALFALLGLIFLWADSKKK